MPFSMKFSSPAKKAARYEKDLRAALQAGNQPNTIATFVAAFNDLCQEKQAQLLFDLVLTYEPQLAGTTLLVKNISAARLRQAIALLSDNQLDEAALLICMAGRLSREAIDLLARRERAAYLAQYLAHDQLGQEIHPAGRTAELTRV